MLFDEGSGSLRMRLKAGRGSARLVVVFSQVRVPDGKFGLERLFARTTHACLFLNQPDNAWYRGADAAIDAAIARAQAMTGAEDLIFYGSSMGGFAALAAAARWPQARVFAFSPDFRIGEPASQSAAAGLTADAAEPDIAALVSAVRDGRIEIVTGLFDAYDAGVAARLAAAALPATVRLTTLASSHELHDHLYSLNIIRKVIATFARDVREECAARSLVVDVADWDGYRAFAAASLAFAQGNAVDLGGLAAMPPACNPGVELLRAAVLEHQGHRGAALECLEALERTIRADETLSGLTKRYLKEVPRRRILLLTELGRTEDAAVVARQALSLHPADGDFARIAGAVADQ
ncbi:hypothetical protein [Oryzibacter oryziterrae]|uniref:hypothetical protein n=1 Tax=Oryzibacter oryziterrae TaxID=2766474 RepID=UPI001F282AE7|nr:hypothetical protein [Oryzibacter oryziterrae]